MLTAWRDSLRTLLLLALVTFATVATLASALGLAENGAEAGAESVLGSRAPRDAAVRITTHLADDSVSQGNAARSMVEALFPRDTIDIDEAWETIPTTVDGPNGKVDTRVVFASRAQLLDVASITDGAWPSSLPNGVALQEDAATALGLTIGDELSLGEGAGATVLDVAALWTANDPSNPGWFADSLPASGHNAEVVGPVVVDPKVFASLPTQNLVTWTLTATPAALSPSHQEDMAESFSRLASAVETTPKVVSQSSEISGALPATLASIAAARQGSVAVVESAIVLFSVLALLAMAQTALVHNSSRERHTLLLRARGLSALQLVVVSAIEASAAVVPSAIIAAVLVESILGTPTSTLLIVAAPTSAVAVTTFATVALTSAFAVRPTSASSGSPLPLLFAGGATAIAAALAIWRLSSGVDNTATNSTAIAAAAPALAIVAVTLVGVAVFGPVVKVLARIGRRFADPAVLLAARQLSVRAGTFLVPVLAIAVSLASAVLATGMNSTWSATERSSRSIDVGADVSARLPNGTDVTAASFGRLPDVDDSTAVLLTTAKLGADNVPFLAVRPDFIERDERATASLMTTIPAMSGLALHADAREIQAVVRYEGDGGAPMSSYQIGVWLSDSDGALVRVPLDVDLGASILRGALPDGAMPWHVVAIESTRAGPADPAVRQIVVSDLNDGSSDPILNVTKILEVGGSASTVRALTVPEPPDEELAVVVTRALSSRLGVGVGDKLSFAIKSSASQLSAKITAVTPSLPGTGSKLAVATDLSALAQYTLRNGQSPAAANAVWLTTNNPTHVAADVVRHTTSTAFVTTSASQTLDPVVAPALCTYWLAAIAAGLLSAVTLATFYLSDYRERRRETAVLRALGLAGASQSRARIAEQASVLAWALVAGLTSGFAASSVAVAPFLASAVPGSSAVVSIRPLFSLWPWLAYLAVTAIVASIIAIAISVRVRRDATALNRETSDL